MYTGRLINRHAQFGRVGYDLVLEDAAGLLPPLRHSVSLPEPDDTPQRREALLRQAERQADSEQAPAARRARLAVLRDELAARRQALTDELARVQADLDRQGGFAAAVFL